MSMEGQTRGPGRPRREEEIKTQRRRRQDTGEGRHLKLHVPESMKDPNFTYRWVNDKPGRLVQLTKQDDWDVVTKNELGGDPDPSKDVSEGTVVSRPVSAAGETAILLRKPRKYFEDDKRKEQESIDKTERSLKSGALPDQQGLTGPNAYVPGGANRIARED